jgi:hypothetical protein
LGGPTGGRLLRREGLASRRDGKEDGSESDV